LADRGARYGFLAGAFGYLGCAVTVVCVVVLAGGTTG